MKIFYLCHRFPFPPKRGGKIRPFNMISHFAQKHDVTVASIVRSEEEAEEGKGLAEHCEKYIMQHIPTAAANWNMITRLPTLTPSSLAYFYSSEFARKIQAELDAGQYDLIFVHCAFVAPYVANVRGPVKILDFGDMDSQKWLTYGKVRSFPLSWGYYLDGFKLLRVEKQLAAQFDMCTCTTRAELDTLRSYNTGTKSDWFPNGVDHQYFSPTHEDYVANSICFIGRMDYYPNQECMFDFCNKVLPEVRKEIPDVTLTIIGANPSPAVKKLEQLQGVTVTGSVPDVRPYVLKSAVNIAPLNIARGTQNKILESLSMGVPVVASATAAGGVDAVPGEHFLTASTPEEYVSSIVRLLRDPAERARFSSAGRERMLSNHDWQRSMDRMDTIVEGCMR